MTHKVLLPLAMFIALPFFKTNAQQLTQTIRGTVTDKVSQTPLPGANVVLLNVTPFTGAATDADGNFKLEKVPIGNQSLKISYLGYKEMVLPNITVNSGKEVVLNLSIEENIVQAQEVVITGDKVEKNKPLNEFSAVSARTFSVEETQKYAAAVNDPARMSMAFAGVVATDDGNNAIAIRGNSPNGLLWRMEGVEIPNPNHFSNVGTAGGGISILSSQVLTNSDFSTGAFPAEYGNALSGVFDLKLRRGNNQKTERTIQIGLLGSDAAIEGPFKKGYNGSYLVNYRYSTLSILGKLGLDIGFGSTTFQDLSFNVYLPTNKFGNFSVFGFGGLSNQKVEADKDSSKWEHYYERYDSRFISNTGAAGITHTLPVNANTFLKTSVIAAGTGKEYTEEELDDTYAPIPQGTQQFDQHRVALSSTLTKKINAQHSFKTGIIASELFYKLLETELNTDVNLVQTKIKQSGNTFTVQGFGQWNYHATEKLSLIGGVHVLTLTENKTYSIEPRASAKYAITPGQSLSIGYGLHSQIQPLGVYFAIVPDANGNNYQPNKNLEFNKSHHMVLSYDRAVTEFLHIKTEAYYQHLFNIPVSLDKTETFALLNSEGGFATDPLTNKGIGRNYGLELTAEQFMHRDFYFLLSASLYDSKYRAANDKWYNTHYNGNFALSFTSGKEFKTSNKFRNRIVGVNLKAIYTGGLRATPIDITASMDKGETVYIESEAYSIQQKNYFRTDLRFSVKRNRKNSTVTWALDLQNASNRKNVYGEYFDPLKGTTKTAYQTSLIPVLSYKVDF